MIHADKQVIQYSRTLRLMFPICSLLMKKNKQYICRLDYFDVPIHLAMRITLWWLKFESCTRRLF